MRDFGDSALFPVYEVLKASILVDGFDLILDVQRSQGSYLRDLRDGTEFLDMFGFFGSSALGMNHPAITDDEEFQQELAVVASNKPSNSDIYTEPMARFVAAFARVLGDAVRHRPGDADILVLQAQVPVQSGRVVLLDDESRRALPLALALARRRLGGLAEVPFAFVLAQLRHRAPDRTPPRPRVTSPRDPIR